MDGKGSIIEPGGGTPHPASGWPGWLDTHAGRHALKWEQGQFDAAVADLFGFHALQCGLTRMDCLRENRMPHRVRVAHPDDSPAASDIRVDHYEALPFATQSLDLVVLPHVLEFSTDPHQILREVDRVLRPEGRIIVSGFNPVSLWGAGQLLGRSVGRPFLPANLRFIGIPRLRDWFKLLGFEHEIGRYGCYGPPCTSARWIERTRFMERAGDRWWPICGAVYLVSAVKRVRGMRLVGPVLRSRQARRAPAAVASADPVRRDNGG
jgi:SAM-dependent methyltransferase